MLEITSFRNGEVLNHNHGKETAEGLEIEIRGIALPQSRVTVNGKPAIRCDREFAAKIMLTEKINRVTVTAKDKFGELSRTITLVYDKNSFLRYTVRIDDNCFVFTDLAKQRPARLFDHFYRAGLKKLHEKYGSKFILKCFYCNDHDPDKFTLDKMPDIWKSEFDDNADWLHFAFHAYSEFPDRPYQHCTAKKLAADLELVNSEITRFAGERACTPPTNVHWAMLGPENFHVMKEHGGKILTSSGFMSNRIIVEGKIEEIEAGSCDIGFFYEQDVAHHMRMKRVFYDPDHELFLSRTFFCFNIDTPQEIGEKIRSEHAMNSITKCEILESIGHEQYAYDYYFNYLPDYFERLDASCRVPTELGYKPVFFQDGIFGNTAWDK